jgi:type II secretory pathway pseudopilin PulG
MVVIVIIGILAAIAIPKLFGMSAKAKASEVGPAVGTWSKLQQAFLVETNNYGIDTKISYIKPGATSATSQGAGTGNFSYESGLGTGAVILGDPGDICTTGECGNKATWVATNPAKLGDCDGGNSWSATLEADKNPLAGVGGDVACKVLTPQFSNLR